MPSNEKKAILSKIKTQKDAKCSFKKALRSFHVANLCVSTIDKNLAYYMTINKLKKGGKCLKISVAKRVLDGFEATGIIKKGQNF